MTLEQIIDALHTRRDNLELRSASDDSDDLMHELFTVTNMLDLYYNIQAGR